MTRIERNKKKIEELGLHALASEVGVPKAEKVRQPENRGAGRLGVSQQGVEVLRITRSRRARTISDGPVGSNSYPGAFSSSPLLNIIPVHFPHRW